MYGSTQFWESYLYGSMKHGSITYGHAVLKGQRLLTWMFGGGSTMLVIFWLQWSDAAIKCLALIQDSIWTWFSSKVPTPREHCFLIAQFMCIRSSLWIPGWKCKPCSLNGFHHVCGCPLRSISAGKRGWRLHFLCCFHTFILVLVLVKDNLGAQSYGYILSFCGEILGHYIWTLHEIKMFCVF